MTYTYVVIVYCGSDRSMVYVDEQAWVPGAVEVLGFIAATMEIIHRCESQEEAYAVAEMISLERAIPLQGAKQITL
jgi:hypothetical protein